MLIISHNVVTIQESPLDCETMVYAPVKAVIPGEVQ